MAQHGKETPLRELMSVYTVYAGLGCFDVVCSDFIVPVCIKSVCYTPAGLTIFLSQFVYVMIENLDHTCEHLYKNWWSGAFRCVLTKYHNLLRSGCPSKSLVSCQIFVFVLGLCHFTLCYIFSCRLLCIVFSVTSPCFIF